MRQTDSPKSQSTPAPDRRRFITRVTGAAVAIAAGASALVKPAAAQSTGQNNPRRFTGKAKTYAPPTPNERSLNAYNLRWRAAFDNARAANDTPFQETNGDEERYPNKIANFSKGLPHKENGEVDLAAYETLARALRSGARADFDLVPVAGTRKLTSPQAGLAFDLEGTDAHSFTMPPPPAFASRETAAEIAENYWMAVMRDVPFTRFASSGLAEAAAADLNRFGNDYKGAKNGAGIVTQDTLFRGLTPGDKTGPYMSQFWYLPCRFGANVINQKIRTTRGLNDGGRDFLTDFNSWLAVQRGVSPQPDVYDSTLRYMRSGRDLGEWVHIDVLYQGYFQAFLVMAGMGVPVDDGNPYKYSANQDGFATFGAPHIATLLCEVATRALKAVWRQKWLVHRRLRPEVFAARIDRTLHANGNYPVHPDILNSLSSSSLLGGNLTPGNALLPVAFPEGSPLHPAYGAGHATVAGACVTILKAWFDEDFVIPNPVVPDEAGTTLVPYTGIGLTVGGELNKIASNVAIGRNMAGVHWRSDATESLKLGEAVAISILRDQKTCYNENFDGFSLTKFDGTKYVGQMVLSQVHTDKVPMPLPNGSAPQVV